MTASVAFQNAPRVLLRQTNNGVSLQSERTAKLGLMLTGRPKAFARTVLPNLLGLCPVAHAEAFDAACSGQPVETAALRVASEAMLEAVRVFVLQWSRFGTRADSDPEALQSIGRLRQQLFAATASRSADESRRVLHETKRFVRAFRYEHEVTYRSVLDAARRFDGVVKVASKRCLSPSVFRRSPVLDGILDELLADRDFAVRPRWQGARVLGGLARECERSDKMSDFSMSDIVRVRWEELGAWASESDASVLPFVPHVRVRDDGWRLSAVETVRGTLLHAVRLQGEMLEGFHMVAPTEWVFQPEGEIVERLNTVCRRLDPPGNSLRDDLDFVVTLFDACTEVDIVLEESYA